MKFKNKLNYELPAWLIDATGEKAECCFKATRDKWFIKPKCNLGNIFQITEPKTVYLYFRFQKNEFMMFEKKFHKIFKYGERRVIEHTTIILDSDSEKENEQAGSESDQRAQALLEEIVASHNARIAAQNVEDLIEPEVDQPARDINLAQLYAFDVKITAAMATTNQVFVRLFIFRIYKHIINCYFLEINFLLFHFVAFPKTNFKTCAEDKPNTNFY
jgi:hypothetical protein